MATKRKRTQNISEEERKARSELAKRLHAEGKFGGRQPKKEPEPEIVEDDDDIDLTQPPKPDGPQTDDELHAYVLETIGMNIPRVAVCPHHDAPFDAFADLYFERVRSALWLAPRGGAKTWMGALWQFLNSRFKSRCEGLMVGAILAQAARGYAHLRALIRATGDNVDASLKSVTVWPNGSQVEIIAGSESAVRGPHPHKAILDEIDEMPPAVRQAGLLMSRSKAATATEPAITAQDLLMSTRQYAHGEMQGLIDEVEEALQRGDEPPFSFRQWCIIECAENQAGICQVANPDLPEGERCTCDRVVKGKWDNDDPRRFSEVCQGKLARSQGWVSLGDLHKAFLTTDRSSFEAEMLCGRASTEGLIFPDFDRGRNCILDYVPRPENGAIFRAVDFGYKNPTATVWLQFIEQEDGVQATDYNSNPRVLPFGTFVAFDLVYKAELTTPQYTRLVKERDEYWTSQVGQFVVRFTAYDVQGAQEAANWKVHGIYPMLAKAPKNPVRQVKMMKEVFDDRLFFISMPLGDMLTKEIESIKYDPNTDGLPHKRAGFDHAFDATRYGIANVKAVYGPAKRRSAPQGGSQEAPPLTAAGRSPWSTAGHQEGSPLKFPRPPGWGG